MTFDIGQRVKVANYKPTIGTFFSVLFDETFVGQAGRITGRDDVYFLVDFDEPVDLNDGFPPLTDHPFHPDELEAI